MRYRIEAACAQDVAQITALYREVAVIGDGLARGADEISAAYVQGFVDSAPRDGVCLLARDAIDGRLCGEIHAQALQPRALSHVFGDVTVAVHPRCHRRGIGRALFEALLCAAQQRDPPIERVELMVRESNQRAIALYESLGFRREGRLVGRIVGSSGQREADIPMGWHRT